MVLNDETRSKNSGRVCELLRRVAITVVPSWGEVRSLAIARFVPLQFLTPVFASTLPSCQPRQTQGFNAGAYRIKEAVPNGRLSQHVGTAQPYHFLARKKSPAPSAWDNGFRVGKFHGVQSGTAQPDQHFNGNLRGAQIR